MSHMWASVAGARPTELSLPGGSTSSDVTGPVDSRVGGKSSGGRAKWTATEAVRSWQQLSDGFVSAHSGDGHEASFGKLSPEVHDWRQRRDWEQ